MVRSGVYVFVKGDPRNPSFVAQLVEVSPHKICKLERTITSGHSYEEVEQRLREKGYDDYLLRGCWLTAEQRVELGLMLAAEAAHPLQRVAWHGGKTTPVEQVGFFEALFGRLLSWNR